MANIYFINIFTFCPLICSPVDPLAEFVFILAAHLHLCLRDTILNACEITQMQTHLYWAKIVVVFMFM